MLIFYRIELFIPASHSLKEKRKHIQSIKSKIRNKFNVSIAEINYMDKWQRSEIAIALIANKQKVADQIFDKILKIMEFKGGVEVIKTTTDFFEYDI